MLLDDLGIRQIAAVIGGSLGGMFVLEWAYFGSKYIRCIVPIATSSRHSAWGISWGEAQRQSIFGDPKYDDGYYSFDDPPSTGLGAARMSALLTYRSRDSFEARFGRNIPDASKKQTIAQAHPLSNTPNEAHFHNHNEGHKIKSTAQSRNGAGSPVSPVDQPQTTSSATNSSPTAATNSIAAATAEINSIAAASPDDLIPSADPQFHGPQRTSATANAKPSLTGGDAPHPATTTYFSAQSYLRYQGQKFVKRFDTNCYIAMTRKLDTHDVSRGRADSISEALAMIEQPTLVLGIESDGLFTFAEQQELAAHIPNARLERIDSPEGHDAFLLQFEQVNRYVLSFLKEVLPDIMDKEGNVVEAEGVGKLIKSSVFGEAEVEDITAW